MIIEICMRLFFLLESENRLVLVLHYLEGFQVREISEMLGIPMGTVKSRLHRGREKLKKYLTEEELDVVIPLGVSKNGKRYENQDYVFKVVQNAEMITLPDQEFLYGNYTVKVSELVKSRTAIMGKVEVIMSEEQKKRYEEDNKILVCFSEFKNVDGTKWKQINSLETSAYNLIFYPEKQEEYFHRQMPEPDSPSVIMDVLLAIKKSQYEEPLDMYHPENIWVKGIEISLMEE